MAVLEALTKEYIFKILDKYDLQQKGYLKKGATIPEIKYQLSTQVAVGVDRIPDVDLMFYLYNNYNTKFKEKIIYEIL